MLTICFTRTNQRCVDTYDLEAGVKCERCGVHERVEITHATLQKMQELRPNIHTIPPSNVIKEGRDLYAICPYCDAYALGAELIAPFLFKDKWGSITTIHEYFADNM